METTAVQNNISQCSIIYEHGNMKKKLFRAIMSRNNYDKLLLALKQIYLTDKRKTITLLNYDALHDDWSTVPSHVIYH